VRTVKVGIGIPKGKDLHVWIDANGKWNVQVAKEIKQFEPTETTEVKSCYREAKRTAPKREYPSRVPYFVFTRPGLQGDFDHDIDMIALHGPLPTEVPIVFDQNEPFEVAYQWYTASGLKCSGDGLVARRKLDLAVSPEENALAEKAEQAGLRTFPIAPPAGKCALGGCEYLTERQCKPHGRLVFQLTKAVRFGGSAQFDTTGRRSISQLHSCLLRFKELTGRGDATKGWVVGIPMFLVVRPYKTQKPDGKPTVQYGVYLEYRAETVLKLQRELMGYVTDFQQVSGMLPPAAPEPLRLPSPEDEDNLVDAGALDAEFYGDFPEHDDEDAPEPRGSIDAAADVADKKIRKLKKNKPETPTTEPEGGAQGETGPSPSPADSAPEQPSEIPAPPRRSQNPPSQMPVYDELPDPAGFVDGTWIEVKGQSYYLNAELSAWRAFGPPKRQKPVFGRKQ
jgi:hypothetical protein